MMKAAEWGRIVNVSTTFTAGAAHLQHDQGGRGLHEPGDGQGVRAHGGLGAEAPDHYAYLQDRRNGATLSTIPGGHTAAAIEAVVGVYRDVYAQNSIFRGEMEISGTDRTIARTSPDHVLAIGRHASGCVSSMGVLGGTMDMPFVFELQGSDGRLSITGGRGRLPGGRADAARSPGAPSRSRPFGGTVRRLDPRRHAHTDLHQLGEQAAGA